MSRLFLRPSARGRRLGQLLLLTSRSEAARRDRALVLDVVDERRSAAIELDERLGLRLVGRRPASGSLHLVHGRSFRLYLLAGDHDEHR